MITSRRAQWLLAAAVAAALPTMAFVSSASAQYQNGQAGHALDANTQVGSGGQNNQGPSNSAVSGNQLITGNSTGGTSFRGPVPYFDPNSFAGPLASQGNDNFVRDSHGVPTPYAPSFSPYTARAFYSTSSLTTAPPPGTVLETFQGSVVGTGLGAQNSNNSLASPLDAVRDQNIGSTVIYGIAPGTQTNNVTMLPQPGFESESSAANSLIVNPAYQNSQVNPITNEPLPFSVLQPAQPNMNDRFGLSQNPSDQLTNPYTNSTTPGQTATNPKGNQPPVQPGPNTGVNPAGAPASMTSNPLNSTLNPAANPSNTGNSQSPSSMLNQQPLNTPLNRYGQNGGGANASMTGSAIDNSLATNQSSRQWLQVPPAQQSTQYRELQRKLDEFNSKHQLTDQEAAAQFNKERILLHPPAGAGGAPGAGGPAGPPPSGGGAIIPGGAPGGPPSPSGGGNAGQNPIKASDLVGAPMRIESLADGVRNAQLKDLLSSAEDLMRHDKFASAAEKYDAALQLTNNTNPMVLLGHANAELGAEFYGRAEADLRRAVAQDPSLLMGQYDLTKMMDPKRIDAVRDDLQTLARDTKSVRPPLLLAYLQYNTGHEADAAKSLAQAESLVGNNDPVVELMRTHWTFQSPQAKPGDMNK